jgi:predicted kinase
MKTVIIVIGPLAALKSTLARRISKRLGIPCFNKDDIKEILADHVGYRNREENLKLSFATFHVMVYAMKNILDVSNSLVLESNFRDFEYRHIKEYLEKVNVRLVTLYLKAEPDVLYDRFKKRLETRHHAHKSVGLPAYEDFVKHVDDYASWSYDKPLIEVDTTDPDAVDFDRLIEEIEDMMG